MRIDRRACERLHVGVPAAAGVVLRFAAEELGRYLGAMSGVRVPVEVDPSVEGAALALAPRPREAAPAVGRAVPGPPGLSRAESSQAQGRRAEDGPPYSSIETNETSVHLTGSTDADVLHAVYRLLESAGCRWSPFGAAHEVVPPLPAAGWQVPELRQEAPFTVRAYATDIHTFHYHEPEWLERRLPADRAFADWMGKAGANAFLFIRHPFDTRLTMPELLPDFERRGIAPEYGGHVMPLLLPRESFAAHPDWFPADRGGRRHDLGNLCVSSEGAMRQIEAAAVSYVERHPEMSVLHIWGADLWDGGWCHCAGCARLTVQDQSLRVCNAVAASLESAGRARPVCYLAYHDTMRADLAGRPHPNVWAEVAPRERCYGHAIDDPSCATNLPYREACERHAELFGGRLRLFEYYGDSILFCGVAVPLAGVIEADLAFYRRCGAREISFLQFGTHSLWAHAPNFGVYAEATRRRGRCAAVAADGSRSPLNAYPADFWRDLEAIMAEVVRYGDVRRPPRRGTAEIEPRLRRASAHLRAWIPRLAADPLGQKELLEYTATVLDGVVLELAGTPAAAEEAAACYARALEIVAGVPESLAGVWGHRDLPVIHSFHSAASRRS